MCCVHYIQLQRKPLIILKIKPINTCGFGGYVWMFVIISDDLNNANFETKIIATPVKLTNTASIMQEVFGVNLSVICVIRCRLVRVLLLWVGGEGGGKKMGSGD
jgi:hypothetical protein